MTRRNLVLLSAFAPVASRAFAFQKHDTPRNRLSPHETVSLDIGNDKVSITYGRPYLKGRQVGGAIAPFGQVWRLGADEATTITVTKPTTIADLKLAPGAYALFAITGKDKWTMIVNKTANQWGAFEYDQAQDLGRFDLSVKQQTSVEQFTIALQKRSNTAATLTFAWGPQLVSTTLKTA